MKHLNPDVDAQSSVCFLALHQVRPWLPALGGLQLYPETRFVAVGLDLGGVETKLDPPRDVSITDRRLMSRVAEIRGHSRE